VLIAVLLLGVVLAGSAMQLFVEPGPVALVASAAIAGAAVFALGFVIPGKLRQTLSGFRFISTLLFALAVAAILGTLILQTKSTQMYQARYGAVGDVIVALRLDDIFHSVWFGGLLALFFAAVLNSAIQRWPLKAKNAGFFTCHVGLLLSLAGAALSTTTSVKGRVDLHAGGEHASAVAVTRGGSYTGKMLPLGFDLRLDRFDVVRYEAEYRIAYYEPTRRVVDGRAQESWMLKASFDPEPGRHRLPGGDSFRVKAFYPDLVARPRPAAAGQAGTPALEYATASKELRNPAVLLEVYEGGRPHERLLVAHEGGGFRLGRGGAIAFEHREDEVKAFRSDVTVTDGPAVKKAVITVNDPLAFGAWTFYQVNYDPRDPTYSGLEAVRDPGVPWVFLGFALISIGVFYMFYVESRLKRQKA
jgi:ResB-like family